MGLPNGRQRSASQASKKFDTIGGVICRTNHAAHWGKFVILIYMNEIDILLPYVCDINVMVLGKNASFCFCCN